MSSQPPRRRRSSSEEDEHGGGLPMVPIFAGVIVAGLGIGALLSAFASRHAAQPVQTSTPIVVTHTPTPIVQRTVAAATPAPVTPKPTPSKTPSPAPTPSATTSASAAATPTATPTAARTPTLKPTASATPKPTEKPTATATARVAIHTPAPPTPARTAAPQATIAPPTTEPATAFAQSLVRRYLDAVAHGDDSAAFSALGGTAGQRLTEMQFLDPTMRITNMTSSRTAGGGTRVQVDVTTAKGQYFGTYTVDSNGTAITEHQMIPVGGTTAR